LASSHNHVHVGAGSLGLGLICWATKPLGLNVTLLNRSSENDNRNNLIKSSRQFIVKYPDETFETVAVDDFLFLDSDQVVKIICDPATVLLTTALKEYGLRAVGSRLGALLKARAARHPAAPLFFIACENACTSRVALNLIIEQLAPADRAAIEAIIHPLDCVVDRICNKPVIENGIVTVLCEQFARWYIETPSDLFDLKGYFHPTGSEAIVLVPSVENYIVRKRWVVNALHLSVALAALWEGQSWVNLYLKREDAARQMFHELASEIEKIFNYWALYVARNNCFDAEEMTQFYESVRARIANHPQRVADAVTRLKEDRVIEFMKDFCGKVVEPFLVYTHESGGTLRFIPRIIAITNKLIAERRFLE
jgi:mannitol-1-phosphate/altronate dehydrogenase